MDRKQIPSMFDGIAGEIKKVQWPSRRDTLQLTLVVVIISSLLGIYIGGLDVLFAQIITQLVNR